jgi:hypothetical protein
MSAIAVFHQLSSFTDLMRVKAVSRSTTAIFHQLHSVTYFMRSAFSFQEYVLPFHGEFFIERIT